MKILKNAIFLFLLLQLCLVFTQPNPQRKTIVIDPGHGGIDSGAIGTNGIKEKDITLKVAQQIVILNSTLFDNRYDINLTRYRDTLLSLTDRTRLAKALKAELFISLHCN